MTDGSKITAADAVKALGENAEKYVIETWQKEAEG